VKTERISKRGRRIDADLRFYEECGTANRFNNRANPIRATNRKFGTKGRYRSNREHRHLDIMYGPAAPQGSSAD
jgi:hypothetical protein